MLFPTLTDCVHTLRRPCVVGLRLFYLWLMYIYLWLSTAAYQPMECVREASHTVVRWRRGASLRAWRGC